MSGPSLSMYTLRGPNAYRDCTGREHCLSTHLRSGRRVVRQSRLGRSVETVFQEGWLTLFGGDSCPLGRCATSERPIAGFQTVP